MDVRLTEHAREQMQERRIRREIVEAVLVRPERRREDPWVEMAYRVMEGREICVITSRRIVNHHLVVTVYDTADR